MTSLSGPPNKADEPVEPDQEPEPLKPKIVPTPILLKLIEAALVKTLTGFRQKYTELVTHGPLFCETFPITLSSEEQVSIKATAIGVDFTENLQIETLPIYWCVALITTTNPVHVDTFRQKNVKLAEELTGEKAVLLSQHLSKP